VTVVTFKACKNTLFLHGCTIFTVFVTADILDSIRNHWPIKLQNRPAEARAFFADIQMLKQKALGTRLSCYPVERGGELMRGDNRELARQFSQLYAPVKQLEKLHKSWELRITWYYQSILSSTITSFHQNESMHKSWRSNTTVRVPTPINSRLL
jgi:hypothetical protein